MNNTEKHAIMEEGADMPETDCLSHPLCLTTLSWNTRLKLITLHPTKSSSKNHNQTKQLGYFRIFRCTFRSADFKP